MFHWKALEITYDFVPPEAGEGKMQFREIFCQVSIVDKQLHFLIVFFRH